MESDQLNPRYSQEIQAFLQFTPDTDNDSISAQYTLIRGLAKEYNERTNHKNEANRNVFDLILEDASNDDYAYFLDLNTKNPQSLTRKPHALEGLQERVRKMLRVLEEESNS